MPAAGELLQIAQGQMLCGLLHPVGPGGGLGRQSCSDLSLLRSQTLVSSSLALVHLWSLTPLPVPQT